MRRLLLSIKPHSRLPCELDLILVCLRAPISNRTLTKVPSRTPHHHSFVDLMAPHQPYFSQEDIAISNSLGKVALEW